MADGDVQQRWHELAHQQDLQWDLDAITNRSEAIEFLRRFENKLCIYSSFVEKLYSNYSFVIPEQEDQGNVTILPCEDAYHDTFHDIPSDAVEPTGIHIFPGECVGHSGLYIKIPRNNRLLGTREMPFQEGLNWLITQARKEDRYFLPVLVKGDLREYEDRMPSLHLHALNPDKLSRMSQLDLDAIKLMIADHLIAMFRQQP